MEREQLKEKALSLPLSPGVYLMKDKNDTVIYVGKAKKLKNRVCQYFQDTANHSQKTRLMVSKIHHFEVIVAASEFEALVLECSLIKKYLPKYNILLKDDKGYPYIRIDMREVYPRMELAAKYINDGAEYFGPYGSRGITNSIIESLNNIYKLPSCAKKLPRDIGKDRLCLHYHMGQCMGWCQDKCDHKEYIARIEQLKQILSGNHKKVLDQIKKQMLESAENLDFEHAAALRDQLSSLEALGKKQLVTAGTLADTDVIGFGQTEAKACFSVLHFSGGNLLDKDYEIIPIPDNPASAVSSLVKQYYINRMATPKRILLPFEMEDRELFTRLLDEKFARKTKLYVPERGDNAKLVSLANKNAYEEAARITTKEERSRGTIALLGKMLSIPAPRRIEAFDVSNISGTDIVAGMVVFEDGKPKKSDYKKFKIRELVDQDDYASMHQTILRRFTNYIEGEPGFETIPDLLLIDGGEQHAAIACLALESLKIYIPVFGMVKDDRHRTRALANPNGELVNIDSQQTVFSFIGCIQEEVHNYAISYHRQLRSKRIQYSALNEINGIGSKRKNDLLKRFKSLSAIASASITELEQCLPKSVAKSVYDYFRNNTKKEEES